MRYDGIMKAAIATIAMTGGPMRITNRISALVCAEHFRSSRLLRRPTAAAAMVAVALMASNKASTSVVPRNAYIATNFGSIPVSSLARDVRVRRVARDLAP